MFDKVDAQLCYLAQKFCDRVQQSTGITKYAIVKWLAIIHYLLAISVLAIDIELITWPLVLFYSILGVSYLRLIQLFERDEEYFQRSGRLLGFTERLFNSSFRRAGLCLFGCLAFFALVKGTPFTVCMNLVAIVCCYVGSCIPRPPSKSTVRKWYEKGLMWLNDKLTDDPEPQTV